MNKAEKIEFLKKQRDDAMACAEALIIDEMEECADSYALDAMRLHKIACDLESEGMKK